MIRLVQIRNGPQRKIALVEEPRLRLLKGFESTYALAHAAISARVTLESLVQRNLGEDLLEYDPVYQGRSDWKLLLPVDHPDEPARCLVSGTGLTHLGSAKDRQALPKSDFALPGKGEGPKGAGSGSYPINNANHARNALAAPMSSPALTRWSILDEA